MTRAARYGNVQPSEFLELDYEESLELARRATVMFVDDRKQEMDWQMEQTKVMVEALGLRVSGGAGR